MKDLFNSGWTQEAELCNGAPTAEAYWTGVECLDPIARPGVVGKM